MFSNIEQNEKGTKVWDILKREFIPKQDHNKNQSNYPRKKLKTTTVKKPNFTRDKLLLFTEDKTHPQKKKYPKEITRVVPVMRENFYHMFTIYRINHNFNVFENEQKKNVYTNDKLNSLFYNLYKNDRNFLINRAKNDPFLHEKETTRIFSQFARNKSKNFNLKSNDRLKLNHKLLNKNLRYCTDQNINNINQGKENGSLKDDDEYILYNLFKDLNSKYNFYKSTNDNDEQLYKFLSDQFEEYNKMNAVSCDNKKINKTIYRMKLKENNELMNSYKFKNYSKTLNNSSRGRRKSFKIKNNKSYNSMYKYTKSLIQNLKKEGENINNIDEDNKCIYPIVPTEKNRRTIFI